MMWKYYVEYPGLSYAASQRCLEAALTVLKEAAVDPVAGALAFLQHSHIHERYEMEEDPAAFDERVFQKFLDKEYPGVDIAELGRLAAIWDDARIAAREVAKQEMPDDPPGNEVLLIRPALDEAQEIARAGWLEVAIAELQRSGLTLREAHYEADCDFSVLTAGERDFDVATRVDPATLARATFEWKNTIGGGLRPAMKERLERVGTYF